MQSIFRRQRRKHLDANFNPTKRSSVKLKDIDNPMAIRKNKYVKELTEKEILKRTRKQAKLAVKKKV